MSEHKVKIEDKILDEIKSMFTHKAKVGLIDGKVFDQETRCFFRLNIASPKSILNQVLNQIKVSISS